MAGYFNDGNGVKNITDGYFYDGDVKYYKDVVTTKYWKEVTKDSKELEYGCYVGSGYITYVKAPIGVENTMHADCVDMCSYVSSSSKLTYHPPNALGSLTEDSYTLVGIKFVRQRDKDLYIDTKVTETVEGTPEDYTHTTTETTTVEVSADDEYDYKEYYPKKIKQIYKVINGEAKLIFNNE